jgi:hypothetical protein
VPGAAGAGCTVRRGRRSVLGCAAAAAVDTAGIRKAAAPMRTAAAAARRRKCPRRWGPLLTPALCTGRPCGNKTLWGKVSQINVTKIIGVCDYYGSSMSHLLGAIG